MNGSKGRIFAHVWRGMLTRKKGTDLFFPNNKRSGLGIVMVRWAGGGRRSVGNAGGLLPLRAKSNEIQINATRSQTRPEFCWNMDLVGFRWISLDFIGFRWISFDFIGFHWISLDLVGFCWSSLDFVGFRWISIAREVAW